MKTTFANAITRTVNATDSVFSFREFGNGRGTPLIFLNCLTGDFEDWDPAFIDGLAAQHRVIIFDNHSVGGLTRAASSNISDMARDAINFIGALGFKLVDLVGLSVGAFVAQRIVDERPDIVRRVILAGNITTSVMRAIARLPIPINPEAVGGVPGDDCEYARDGQSV